jgi:hypothetical protein
MGARTVSIDRDLQANGSAAAQTASSEVISNASPDGTSNAVGLPLDTRFRGSFASAYRIDSDGSLRYADAAYPSGTQFVDSSKITALRIWPQWLNAPAQIFDRQDKVQAFARLRVSQDNVQEPMKSPLSWTGIYSLLTADHQNLNPSHTIGSDDQSQGTLDGIVLPNGTGELSVAWWAIIGPPAKTFWTIWSSTWARLMSIANNQVGSAFLPVPAASLAVANEIEQLLAEIVLAFHSDSTQQRWVTDDSPTPLQFSDAAGSGNGQAIVVPANARTRIILVPDASQPGDKPQIDAAIEAKQYPQLTPDSEESDSYSYKDYLTPYLADNTKAQKFTIEGSGEVRTTSSDNPFGYLPYVTIDLLANSTGTPNQGAETRPLSLAITQRRSPAIETEASILSDAGPTETPAPIEELPKLSYCTSRGGLFYSDPNDKRVTTKDDMANAVSAMQTALYGSKTIADGITLFFHGGLVDESSGYNTALSLVGPYGNIASSDVPAPGGSYPYFFVYETGIWNALINVAPGVLGSAFFKALLDHFGLGFGGLFPEAQQGARTMAAFPRQRVGSAQINATIQQVQRAILSDPAINAECQNIATYEAYQPQAVGMMLDAATTTTESGDPVALHMKPEMRQTIAADVQHGHLGIQKIGAQAVTTRFDLTLPGGVGLLTTIAAIGWRIGQRMLNGHDHGLACTITEEIIREMFLDDLGFEVWKDMKTDADAACTDGGVAATMIQNLDETFWQKGQFPRLILVGHSEGAHFVARFLQAVDAIIGSKYGAALKFDVIFMAAAVRTDVWANALGSSAGKFIRNYIAFGMHDAVESSDQLLAGVGPGFVYPRSLLYYISGVLEHTGETGSGTDFPDCPLVGMERFLDGLHPFAPNERTPDVTKVVTSLDGHDVFSLTSSNAIAGRQSQASHHGGFPTDPETLRSCAYLIANQTWQ